jgi:hypothetical protein
MPGRLERRGEHGGGEQQQDQGHDRHARHGHRPDEDGANRVAGHHHRAARTTIGQVGEEQPPDHPRQVPGGVRHGGQQRRPGPVIDQHGEGDQGQAIARRGQDHRQPQGAELAHREDIAERRTRRPGSLHGRVSRGPSREREMQASRGVPSSEPFRSIIHRPPVAERNRTDGISH